MLMPTNHLQREVVIITPICILEADLGSPLSSRPCTEGQCKIAGWQHMVCVWISLSQFSTLGHFFRNEVDLRASVL